MFVYSQDSIAQKKFYSISGIVKNADTKLALPYVNIAIVSLARGDVSSEKGLFVINKLKKGEYELTVSCIGYLKNKVKFTLSNNTHIDILLSPISTHLEDLVVISQRQHNSSSSSVISREAIAHVQATNFSDILELLPGGLLRTNSLVSMNLASFREASSGTSNSSLGTAFVVDGMQMSNDAQLQTVVGAGVSNSQYTKRNTTGKGIDMRMIPVDDIESVEVITGVPSVEYGELTNALVIVNRVFRETPFIVRLKADPRGKLLSLAKGFSLNKNNTLNSNFSYINHNPDPRDIKLSYSRMSASLRYKYTDSKKDNPISLHTNIDYLGSLDENKKDTGVDLKTDSYKYSYRQYRLSNKFEWFNNSSAWFNKLTYTLNASYSHQETKINRLVNTGALRPMPIDFSLGVKDGFYLPASYESFLNIDGKPLHLNSKLKINLGVSLFSIVNNITIGTEYVYNKNFGEGRVNDISTPLFPLVRSSFARKSKDVPASKKLSFFLSDNINLKLHKHTINILLGLRSTSMLGINSRYLMANKYYLDTRSNISWKLPDFYMLGEEFKMKFILSYANNTRFPTLSYLYPEKRFFNKIQLNFYSNRPGISKVNFKTSTLDPTNYNIKPSRNIKKQFAINLSYNKVQFELTYFDEKMHSAYKSINKYFVNNYTKYDASSVDATTLSEQAKLSDFSSHERKSFETYSMVENAGLTYKKGVEYSLNLGMVKPLYSRISVNGAWYKTKYDLMVSEYRNPSIVLDNKVYPYMGVYSWDGGKTYQRFNTNLRIDTQISKLGLIFTSAIQALWFTKSKSNYNSGLPTHYYDLEGNKHIFRADDINDHTLVWMSKKNPDLAFVEDVIPLAADLNLRITKLLGNKASLSFYVNSLLHYRSRYKTKYDFTVKRSVFPRFGMELKIKI